MNHKIQQNIKENIIKYDPHSKGFECLICDVPLSGEASVTEHLKSKRHGDIGGKIALRNLRVAPQSIRDLLSDTILSANSDGDLKLSGTEEIMCLICNSPTQGMIALNKHLESKSHIKKKEERAKALDAVSQSPNLNILSPEVQQAVSEKVVDHLPDNKFKCNVCKCLPITGEIPLKDHLISKKHREAGAKYVIANISRAPRSLVHILPKIINDAVKVGTVVGNDSGDLECTLCRTTLSGIISMEQHLLGDDHKKNVLHQSYSSIGQVSPNAVPSISSSSVLNLERMLANHSLDTNQEIKEALSKCIVIETDDKLEPFSCKLCDKNFNSSGPLLDHLRSKKHISKEKMLQEFQTSPSVPKDAREPSISETSTPLRRHYSVISDPRGHVYVFNNSFRYTNHVRGGAEHDTRNLRETFERMKYKVFLYEDQSYDETEKALTSIQRNPDLNGVDSFILCVLSHGVDDSTFYCNDMKEMKLKSIRQKFTDRKCPYLRGKPKIFLANYCRGDQLEKKRLEYKNRLEEDDIEAPRDMVTIHASTEGIKARRDPFKGTIFITAFCDQLKSHVKEYTLRDLYEGLEDIMAKKGGTTPMWEDCSFKSFYFNLSK